MTIDLKAEIAALNTLLEKADSAAQDLASSDGREHSSWGNTVIYREGGIPLMRSIIREQQRLLGVAEVERDSYHAAIFMPLGAHANKEAKEFLAMLPTLRTTDGEVK